MDKKFDKEGMQRQQLFGEESTTIVAFHLRFHLDVSLPDSKDYNDISACFVKM